MIKYLYLPVALVAALVAWVIYLIVAAPYTIGRALSGFLGHLASFLENILTFLLGWLHDGARKVHIWAVSRALEAHVKTLKLEDI